MIDYPAIDLALRVIQGVLIPAIGFLAWHLQRVRDKAQKAEDRASALAKELADFKLEVAKERAINGFITEVRDELRGDMLRLEAKVDRLIEIHTPRRRE